MPNCSFYSKWINLIYPSLCLHCEREIENERGLFCDECVKELTLLDPLLHCPLCFASLVAQNERFCQRCRKGEQIFCNIGAAFPNLGVPQSLLRFVLRGEQVRSAAAYMVMQFLNLNWKKPDIIAPFPIRAGGKFNFPLSYEISSFLNVPTKKLLSMKQNNLYDCVVIPTKKDIADQIILFVCAYLIKDEILKQSMEVIAKSNPREIYVLALCMED